MVTKIESFEGQESLNTLIESWTSFEALASQRKLFQLFALIRVSSFVTTLSQHIKVTTASFFLSHSTANDTLSVLDQSFPSLPLQTCTSFTHHFVSFSITAHNIPFSLSYKYSLSLLQTYKTQTHSHNHLNTTYFMSLSLSLHLLQILTHILSAANM